MAGTKAGGLKAAATNKERYGEDFYSVIGKEGGHNGTTGGFAYQGLCECTDLNYEHRKAECAGKKGGVKSKRGKARKEWPLN